MAGQCGTINVLCQPGLPDTCSLFQARRRSTHQDVASCTMIRCKVAAAIQLGHGHPCNLRAVGLRGTDPSLHLVWDSAIHVFTDTSSRHVERRCTSRDLTPCRAAVHSPDTTTPSINESECDGVRLNVCGFRYWQQN